MKRFILPLAVAPVILLSACTAAQTPTPSTPTSQAASAQSPDAEPTTTRLPSPSPRAIARAVYASQAVEAKTLTNPTKGTSYSVRAACTGTGTLKYSVIVADTPLTNATLRCGQDVLNSAYTATSDSPAQLLIEPSAGVETALAEIVPTAQ